MSRGNLTLFLTLYRLTTIFRVITPKQEIAMDKIDWDKLDIENEAYTRRAIASAKKRSPASRDFFDAIEQAKQNAKEDGLIGKRNEYGTTVHTIKQGLKASCYAREDAAAILIIQMKLLERLDRNYGLMWIIAILLGYIAYRLS
jgi:hypothetical protein